MKWYRRGDNAPVEDSSPEGFWLGAAIEVVGLAKRYGDRAVLADVAFTVPERTIYCLLGRNGAGKTTTVECIEGFRTPDGGTVRILGHDPVAERPLVAPHIGVMLQEGGAYQAATPREMLRLYTGLFPGPRDAGEVLRLTGLEARAAARFRTLSGGEKQRVNLALAIVGNPTVLFLDEPTAGMDPAARRDAWTLIERLRDDGAAILLTTHFLDEAQRLADAIGILHDGRIVREGAPAELTSATAAIEVVSSPDVDVAALSADIGAPVERVGNETYRIAAPADRISAVSAWLAARGEPIGGIAATTTSLEDVFLELTEDGDQ